jgi:amidophosphoribosyltransferase
LLANAQPVTAQLVSGPLAVAHNGNIVNAVKVKKELQADGAIFHGTSDTEILLHLLSHTSTSDLIEALRQVAPRLEGAYSFLIQAHDKLIALRDPLGFRPLCLARKKNDQGTEALVFSSETCAFDLIGAQYDREIEPGELFWVDDKGEHSLKNFVAPAASTKQAPSQSTASGVTQCIFEHVYFSRPDSVVFGRSVYESRKNFGRWLAKETAVQADLVIPVPDSGTPAAIGYSQESGIPFELGIIRNHYIGRTFIQPQQSIRSFGVKIKLNPQSAVLKGKRVVVVDDSLVRGTTSQKIVSLIRQAGASEVHMRIASPPTIGPCFYGVDTPHKDLLIASHKSISDIARFIEADSLGYLSNDGLHEALQESSKQSRFCAACFDGKYPTPLYE